jgi:hypothetical protein
MDVNGNERLFNNILRHKFKKMWKSTGILDIELHMPNNIKTITCPDVAFIRRIKEYCSTT